MAGEAAMLRRGWRLAPPLRVAQNGVGTWLAKRGRLFTSMHHGG
jgi:hypothetical protein